MDIVSYSKAMQGRKNLDSLNKRLGVGDYKNGDKDIKGIFANVKARLDELEKKRQGLIDKVKVVSVQEGSITNGVWASNVIHLGEDALELKSLKVIGSLMSAGENLAKGGTASASSFRNISKGYLPELAFDGQKNNGMGWQTGPGTSPPHWIQYEWNTEKTINMYMIRARNSRTYLGQSPKSWIFQGWDGEKWVDLDAQINQINWGEYEERRYSFGSNKSFMKYRIYVTETNGAVDSDNSMPVNIDEIELYSKQSSLVELTRDKVKVSVKTTSDFIDIGNSFEIVSKFSKNLQIQVTVLDEAYKLNNVSISYQNRPLPNRVSDLETSIHINLNKHNLRVNSLLDKKRYNMKDMIIDDFGDNSGIDVEKSENITYDKKKHKVKQSNAQQPATFITVSEQLDMMPKLFLLSGISGKATRESGWIKYPEAPLTSNTSNSLNVIWETSITNFKGTQPWQVFDGNEELSATHAHYYYNWRNYYVGLDFKDSPKHIEKVYISSVSLVEFQVICSNDKINWKIAYSGNHGAIEVNGSPTATPKEYEFDNIGSYRYWAIRTITSVPNNWHGTMNELAFFENKDQDIMTQDPSKSEGLEYYVSRNNGEDWMRIEKDKLVSLDKLPEGKELVVKVVLKSGEELHAISYSWL
ncbi:discoidin domain-containing protein [Bacillus thuringiensis]|uniref:discoidin domain-containing protein n=1 Tax=Bacillus thuringiensis TaxID=1428 RepID=UPI00366D8374